MDISSIKSQGLSETSGSSRSGARTDKSKSSSEKEVTSSASGDKLVISSEARNLVRILSRIRSGYYDNPEVIQATAEKINQEISGTL